MPNNIPRTELFLRKIHKTDSCWFWLGVVTAKTGYGHVTRDGKTISVHRYSWELKHGPVPEGMCVLHECDIRNCVNPDHLSLGTHVENQQDRLQKGNSIKIKLLPSDVSKIKELRASGVLSEEVAKQYKISRNTVWAITSGRTWMGYA